MDDTQTNSEEGERKWVIEECSNGVSAHSLERNGRLKSAVAISKSVQLQTL